MTKSRNILSPPRRRWKAWEEQFLRENYADQVTKLLAEVLGRPVGQVYQKADKLGLKKSAEYLAGPYACRLRRGDDTGIAHRFKPGHASWNAGRTGTTGHHPNTAANHFKPGELNGKARRLWKPIGTLRISDDGHLQRKVRDDGLPQHRWVSVHRLVWEAAHGPVPAGHVVAFRAGLASTDEAAITPDALELVTRAEMMRRNSHYTRLPRDLSRLVQLRGALSRQINRKTHEAAEQAETA